MICLQTKTNIRTVSIFTYHPTLRPALPCVYGPLDYREQRALFERIDLILSCSGLEQEFINSSHCPTGKSTRRPPVPNPWGDSPV